MELKHKKDSNTTYYIEDAKRFSSTTTVRVKAELLEKAKNYAHFDTDFNVSKFLNQALEEFFQDENAMKNRIFFLKKELKKAKKLFKNYQNLNKIALESSEKLREDELSKFKQSLEEKENYGKKRYWIKCLEIVGRNADFLKGQYSFYRNTFGENLSIEAYGLFYQYARELAKRGELRL